MLHHFRLTKSQSASVLSSENILYRGGDFLKPINYWTASNGNLAVSR